MLEYIYTNEVKGLELCNTTDIINLFILANQYCMQPLQYICEYNASLIINSSNISKFILLTYTTYTCNILKNECKKYLINNLRKLRDNETFRREIEESPQLGTYWYIIIY